MREYVSSFAPIGIQLREMHPPQGYLHNCKHSIQKQMAAIVRCNHCAVVSAIIAHLLLTDRKLFLIRKLPSEAVEIKTYLS